MRSRSCFNAFTMPLISVMESDYTERRLAISFDSKALSKTFGSLLSPEFGALTLRHLRRAREKGFWSRACYALKVAESLSKCPLSGESNAALALTRTADERCPIWKLSFLFGFSGDQSVPKLLDFVTLTSEALSPLEFNVLQPD